MNKKKIIIGEENTDNVKPELTRNKSFWPANVCYDGTYLWLGEFKFSGRIMRFSPSE